MSNPTYHMAVHLLGSTHHTREPAASIAAGGAPPFMASPLDGPALRSSTGPAPVEHRGRRPRSGLASRGGGMTLADHLDELRRRLAWCLLAVVLGSGVGFAFAGHLLEFLKRPAGALLPQFAFFSPTEALFAYVHVAVTFGVVVALPVLLYEAWAFIESALTRTERLLGLLFVWLGSLPFAGGVACAYAVLLPVSLRVLLAIGSPSLMPM